MEHVLNEKHELSSLSDFFACVRYSLINDKDVLDVIEDTRFDLEGVRAFLQSSLNREDDKIIRDSVQQRLQLRSSEMIKKRLNGTKQASRDFIIALCAAYGLNPEETNRALHIVGLPSLDCEVERDNEFHEMLKQRKKWTIAEINKLLSQKSLSPIYISQQKSEQEKKRIEAEQKKHLYPFGKLQVTRIARIAEDAPWDQYDSLETKYLSRARIYAKGMIGNAKVHHILCAKDRGDTIICTIETLQNTELSNPNNVLSFSLSIVDGTVYYEPLEQDNRTRPLLQYYKDLCKAVLKQKRTDALLLFDSRNYGERISANIKNDAIHVFWERYNYEQPEQKEYLLFELVNGKYRLSVNRNNGFMKEYLSQNEYMTLYGTINPQTKASYDSEEKIDRELSETNIVYEQDRLKSIKRAFLDGKAATEKLLSQLRERAVFVRNADMIFDEPMGAICEYYQTTGEFQCRYDEQCDMWFPQKELALIEDEEGHSVQVSLSTQKRAFELGVTDKNQLVRILIKDNNIENLLK